MKLQELQDTERIIKTITEYHRKLELHPPETFFFKHLPCKFDHVAMCTDTIWNSITVDDPLREVKMNIGRWYDNLIHHSLCESLEEFLLNSK
jgi:hypothetical protein